MKQLLLATIFCTTFNAYSEADPTAPIRLYANINNTNEVILIDRETGKPLMGGEFATVHQYNKMGDISLATAKNHDNQWSYIDTQGQWISTQFFDEAKAFSSDDIARVKKDDKWGFLKNDGSFLIKPIYENVTPFNQGLAAVQEKKDGEVYFINLQGEKAFSQSFSDATMFADNGLAAVAISESIAKIEVSLDKVLRKNVQGNTQWGYINTQGEIVIPAQFQGASRFNQFDVARARDQNDDDIIINTKGEVINDTRYAYLWDFSESGVAWSKSKDQDGFVGYINPKGEPVWEASYHDFNKEQNGLLVNARNGYQVFDPTGNLIIKEESTWATSFTDADAAIALRDQWGFLFRNGEFKTFPERIVAPLTDTNNWVLGLVDGLIPMVNKAREVEYFNKQGVVKYKLKANDNNRMALFDSENSLVWESAHKAEKFEAFLSPGPNEHFFDVGHLGEGIYQTIDDLLKEKPRKYFIPNPIFSESDDPYQMTADIESYEEIKKGSLNILAQTYVSEEEWGTYYYLNNHDFFAFSDYSDTIEKLISEKYGAPYDKKYEGSIWQVDGQFLVLSRLSDSGDGDYYYQLTLEVNPEKPND